MPESNGPVVAIIDDMGFRRALVCLFLSDWAGQENVLLVPYDWRKACRELGEFGGACKMTILNLGARAGGSEEALADIKSVQTLAPDASVVVMADEEDPDDILAVMQAGACGYLSNRSDPELALRALSFVLRGGTYFPRSFAAQHGPGDPPGDPPPGADPASERDEFRLSLPDLSARQNAILAGLCRGEPNKIIGRRLGLPESTVKVHVREIMKKLSVSNRTQVAIAASQLASRRFRRLPGVGRMPGADATSSPPEAVGHRFGVRRIAHVPNETTTEEAPDPQEPDASPPGPCRP